MVDALSQATNNPDPDLDPRIFIPAFTKYWILSFPQGFPRPRPTAPSQPARPILSWPAMPGGYGNANNWPKKAESLGSWLDAILLVRIIPVDCPRTSSHALSRPLTLSPVVLHMPQPSYKERLSHLDLRGLRDVSATTLKELVPIDGHRRRLVYASQNDSHSRPTEAFFALMIPCSATSHPPM